MVHSMRQRNNSHITIQDGERLVERSVCRRVMMPNGQVGAIWRGQAFPLLDGDVIDIAGEFETPSACLPLVDSLGSLGTAYALIEGAEEACLLIGGSVVDRDRIAADLTADGLRILRTGRHLGEAAAGLNWLVRFVRPAAGEPLVDRLERLIGPRAAAPALPGGDALRLQLLEGALMASRAERERLRDEITRLRSDRQPEAAVKEPTALDSFDRQAEIRLAEALAENERLREVLAQPTRSMPVAAASNWLHNEISLVLEILLPRIELIGDSLLYISTELSNRRALYRTLHELAAGNSGMPLGWKRLKGITPWWERHLTTGHDDTGRIYASLGRNENCWRVLVSGKADQRRDIARLQRIGAP